LRDEDVQIAAESSVALIRIGKAAIPTLERTLANEKDLIVIVRVVATLRRLGDDAVPVLVKATRQANPTVRTLANDALESMAKEKR
jgi:HEAT repeat protein